jgi:hypothetical protein
VIVLMEKLVFFRAMKVHHQETRRKVKEKISVTDKEKILSYYSARCKLIQFDPSPTKCGFTPVYQPRFLVSEAITESEPQNDNSMVTYAVTVQVLQEDDNTTVTDSLTVPVLEDIPVRDDNTSVTKAIGTVVAVEN